MIVFVIKDEKHRYQTPSCEWIDDLRQADLFLSYEIAKHYCPRDCEVVKCHLIEESEVENFYK